MGYPRLVVVLTGTSALVVLVFRKVIRTCAALVSQEDAVESVGAHLVAVYIHYLGNAFWNSVSYTSLWNACHKHWCPIAILGGALHDW